MSYLLFGHTSVGKGGFSVRICLCCCHIVIIFLSFLSALSGLSEGYRLGSFPLVSELHNSSEHLVLQSISQDRVTAPCLYLLPSFALMDKVYSGVYPSLGRGWIRKALLLSGPYVLLWSLVPPNVIMSEEQSIPELEW